MISYDIRLSSKLSYNMSLRQLRESGEINILQIKSCDNLADLFTECTFCDI
jgi:hypothetical protein